MSVPDTLSHRLQTQCAEWNVYWRASDSHGVELTKDQAVALLEVALGVEVEIEGDKIVEALREQAEDWRRKADGLVDIYFDGVNHAPDDRCYIEGALGQVMQEVKTALDAHSHAEEDAPRCAGANCNALSGQPHSTECLAEHARTIDLRGA